MHKLIAIAVVILLLSSCATKGIRIKTETQVVYAPILYCPAPPQIDRPQLPIHHMTPEQLLNSGEVVKHYKASLQTLLGYTKELERTLETYDETNKAYDELRKKFEGDWQEEFKVNDAVE